MSDTYFILFRNGAPADWSRAGDILAQSNALAKGEATKACRRGHGFINIPLPKERAVAGIEALKSCGLEACIVSCNAVVNVPPLAYAVAASVDPEGLKFQRDQKETPIVLPWNRIRIVFAGYVRGAKRAASAALAEMNLQRKSDLSDEISNIGTGLAVGAMVVGGFGPLGLVGARALAENMDPRNMPAIADTSAKTPEACIDLVCVNPAMRVRICQRGFSYQYLGARKAPTVRGNFRLLVNDLINALPSAIRSGLIKEAAAGMDLEQEKYIREQSDVDHEMTAILTRALVAWSS